MRKAALVNGPLSDDDRVRSVESIAGQHPTNASAANPAFATYRHPTTDRIFPFGPEGLRLRGRRMGQP